MSRKVRRRRRWRYVTQYELAKKTDLSVSTIYTFENKCKPINLVSLIKIVTALGGKITIEFEEKTEKFSPQIDTCDTPI